MTDRRSPAVATALAARQHGVLTPDQAVAAGLSKRQIATRIDSGVWHRPCEGVLAVTGSPRSWEQSVMVALLASGGEAMASYASAARILDVGRPYSATDAVEITVPWGTRPRKVHSLGVTIHVSRHLTPKDRACVNHIPATRAARLVVDLLGHVPDDVLFPVADDVFWRLNDRREVRAVWERIAAGRRRRPLEAVELPWTEGPKPGSPKEMAFSRVLQLHGLPRPVRQHRIEDPRTGGYRDLDLAYIDAKIALEYDGRATHGPRQWKADASREDWLADVGWLRLPASGADLVEPGATRYCTRVRAALLTRMSYPGGQPSRRPPSTCR